MNSLRLLESLEQYLIVLVDSNSIKQQGAKLIISMFIKSTIEKGVITFCKTDVDFVPIPVQARILKILYKWQETL